MDEKYISKEVFEARMDVFEEKINGLTQEMAHISNQLSTISEVVKILTAHEKDIESIRRETERNKLAIEQIRENNSKIVWAIGGTILAVIVQFAMSGGFFIRR